MGGKDGGRTWDGCEMVGVEQESEMGEPNGAGAGEQGVESQDRARVKGELRVRLRAGSGNRVKP